MSDDSDNHDGEQFEIYVFTGVARRLDQGPDAEANTVQSLGYKRRQLPVVEIGTAFRLKSPTGTTDYLIVRVGIIVLSRT